MQIHFVKLLKKKLQHKFGSLLLEITSKKISRMYSALNLARKFTGHPKMLIDNQIFIELLDANFRSLCIFMRRSAAESGIQLAYYFRSFCS
jgi:hypothetical protein